MGSFAETAIVSYLLFCQPRKTKFHFSFPFVANKRKLDIFVFHCSKKTEVPVFRKFHFQYRQFIQKTELYIYTAVSNAKQKLRQFSLNPLPLAYCTNRSLLFVRLLVKEQTEVITLQTDLMD